VAASWFRREHHSLCVQVAGRLPLRPLLPIVLCSYVARRDARLAADAAAVPTCSDLRARSAAPHYVDI
jgi:hypothetical protein